MLKMLSIEYNMLMFPATARCSHIYKYSVTRKNPAFIYICLCVLRFVCHWHCLLPFCHASEAFLFNKNFLLCSWTRLFVIIYIDFLVIFPSFFTTSMNVWFFVCPTTIAIHFQCWSYVTLILGNPFRRRRCWWPSKDEFAVVYIYIGTLNSTHAHTHTHIGYTWSHYRLIGQLTMRLCGPKDFVRFRFLFSLLTISECLTVSACLPGFHQQPDN